MARDYRDNLLLNKLNTSIATLEANPNPTQEEIKKVVDLYDKTMLMGNYSKEDISELEDRLKVYSSDLSIGGNSKTEIQQLLDVSPRSYKVKKNTLKGALIGVAILAASTSVAGCTLRSCNTKAAAAIEAETDVESIETPEPTATPKILAEHLAFDPNDNIEIVSRMSDFIADALTKGIPVKDVMTEDELKLADENEQSLVTIEQLMDFYMVMNIEDIDPIDYARLGYNSKTAETITDNYMYCARVFMTDALTATEDTKLNYDSVIADKDSSEAVQKFIGYLAEYNSSDNKKELGNDIQEYIVSNYINRDANIYSMSINEFTYRMMFVADMISNNSILPTDVNVILNEDGKISCDLKKEDGIKNKTERAEEFTSIYNTVEEKLEISREFINQDLTSISDDEKKTGIELEKEIKEAVLIKNVSYKVNPVFTTVEISKEVVKGTTTEKNYETFVDANGNQVNISAEELAKYGATNQAEYEQAKKDEFDKKAKEDPNHTITNPDGDVVVSGGEVDTAKYNEGFAAGYSDGNKYLGKNPGSSNKSYVAGYEAGYKKGYADRVALDEQLKQNQPKPDYEDTPDKKVGGNESIEEKPYVEPTPAPTPVPEQQPTPVPEQQPTPVPDNGIIEEFVPVDPTPAPETVVEEFVPVEEPTAQPVTETIEEITYTSSINNLKNLKAELLAMSNIYTEEVSKSKC